MGCDIHLFVEAKRDGKWQRERVVPVQFRDPWLLERGDQRAEVEWYDDRNYEAFAVLADVRNRGYVVPISQPKGWPDDLSDEGRRLIADDRDYDENDVNMGDHSASWLTLAELQAYPWGDRVVQGGVVPLQDFMQRCIKHGMGLPVEVDRYPYKEWSQGITGPRIVTREASEVLAAISGSGFAAPEGERTYVHDEWSTPAAAQVGSLKDRLIPALESLGLPPTDVRIVFNFDN